jgi:hypothetical protein
VSHEQQHLFDLYFQFVEKTEPPTIYHRWSLITGIGALLGRKYWMPFGANRIFPNQYVMLIGNAGARKSTAIKMAAKVLKTAGYEHFAAEKTTKEKFLLDLEGAEDDSSRIYQGRENKGGSRSVSARDVLANLELESGTDNHDGIPREVFITADEFNEFAGSGNLDFLSMLGALWDWDDESGTYKHRFKNSKSISIYQPTISLIGGNTHVGFKNAFPEAAIGQGFLSRLILVYSEPSGRKITFPEKPSEAVAIAIGERLSKIAKTVTGEATLSLKARQALDTIYRTWTELEDYRFKSYSTRRQTHLFKLCLITSAMRVSSEIDIEDVILANTILTWAESSMDKALGEYGKSRNSEVIQTIMAALYSAKEPMKMGELFKLVRRDLNRQDELPGIMNDLVSAGKVQYIKETSAFAPLQKAPNGSARYVDFSLLKESKE